MSCKVFSTFLFSTEDVSADNKPDVVNADSKGSEEEGENSEDRRHGGDEGDLQSLCRFL